MQNLLKLYLLHLQHQSQQPKLKPFLKNQRHLPHQLQLPHLSQRLLR
jgi:hypothetical protein